MTEMSLINKLYPRASHTHPHSMTTPLADDIHYQPVREVSGPFHRSPQTIRRWIKKEIIDGKKTSEGYVVLFTDKTMKVFRRSIEEYHLTPREAYTPQEISEYNEWHQTLDELCSSRQELRAGVLKGSGFAWRSTRRTVLRL